MRLNVLFNPGQSCTFSTFPPSYKCSFWPGLSCTFSPPILWRGGDLSNVLFQLGQFAPSHLCLWGEGESQMFFLNSGSLYLLTSACGEGGILNVPFKPRQIVSFHLCLGGGGGGSSLAFPMGNYIMSWFTPSILYIIFSSFNLILSCERLINILFILFQLDKARVQ